MIQKLILQLLVLPALIDPNDATVIESHDHLAVLRMQPVPISPCDVLFLLTSLLGGRRRLEIQVRKGFMNKGACIVSSL
jgi:uncharacterized phosphosugar-binding protein